MNTIVRGFTIRGGTTRTFGMHFGTFYEQSPASLLPEMDSNLAVYNCLSPRYKQSN